MSAKLIFLLLLLGLLCPFTNLIAGDDICNATEVLINGGLTEFDNVGNTNSTVDPPPYGGYAGPDTWIEFIMPNVPMYLNLYGTTMLDPAIAIYEGPCDDPKLLYNVLDNNCDGSPSPALLIENLDPGETYYLRVWPENASQNGAFFLSISDFLPGAPNFEVFQDASIDGDCIILTQAQNTQQGCAWNQIAIDFNESFTHTMTANFGTKDGNGADGLCLVYQSAGPSFCGGSGEGIGALGMPNSAIFEFDTWRNGNLNDPVDDHTSFNINGNMNHNNSINGPVTLGNIEDGLDHTITFQWNPIGNAYSLFFDNVLVLSGSFDFITNCFAGDNLAYWGYTSATGGSNNLHVICPVEDFFPSTIDYFEVEICEGGFYNNFTEAGYYTELIPGPDGCFHQNNILITVNELSPPFMIDTVICEGQSVEVNNQDFSTPFVYLIETITPAGCDSTIILDLEVIELEVAIDQPPILTCEFSEFNIGPTVTTNVPDANIEYLWSQDGSTTDSITVSSPGQYTVFVSVELNGTICQTFETVTVFALNDPPDIEEVDDIFLECETSDSTFQLVNNADTTNAIYYWSLNGDVVSNQNSVDVFVPGEYVFTLLDTITGCLATDNVNVVASDMLPTVDIQTSNLDCDTLLSIPDITVSSDVVSYNWILDGNIVDSTADFTISQGGTYVLQVANANGCSSQTQFVVTQDTITPQFNIADETILCDSNSVTINTNLSVNYQYSLSGPEDLPINLDSLIISQPGEYIVIAENPINNCTYADTFLINTLGNSPTVSFISDTLDCNVTSFSLTPIADQSALSYEWSTNGSILSNDSLLQVDTPSEYCLISISETGCFSKDSITIFQDLTAPIVDLLSDTIDCTNPSTFITYENQPNYITTWSDEDGNNFDVDSLNVNQPAFYFVDVENINTGCHSYDTIEVFSNSILPDYTLMDGKIDCNAESLNLDFIINNAYDSLSWSGPMQFQSDQESPLINASGTYNIYVDLGGGCIIDTFIIIAEDFATPDILVAFDSITCNKTSADISLLGEVNSIIDLIDPNNSTISNITEYTTDIEGNYSAIVIGENGCVDTVMFEVLSYINVPEFDVEDQGPISCNSEVSGFTTTASTSEIFSWTGPNGFSQSNANITVTSGGEYTLIVQDQYGCTNSGSFIIEEFLDPPVIDLSGGSINCQDVEAEINVVGDGENDLIEWRTSGDYISDQQMINVTQGGIYYCIVTNEYGCEAIDSFEVLENTDSPLIIPVTETSLVFFPSDIDKDIIVNVNSTVDYSLSWMPEDAVSCSDCDFPTLIDLTIDSLIVIAENIYGCMDTLVFQIRSESLPKIMVTNIFTPNDDGNNDFFTLFANDEVEEILTMLIYDRWGEKVEEKNNFLPNDPSVGWNGKFKNSDVISGVYVYYFKVLTIKGEEIEVVGDVTVMR